MTSHPCNKSEQITLSCLVSVNCIIMDGMVGSQVITSISVHASIDVTFHDFKIPRSGQLMNLMEPLDYSISMECFVATNGNKNVVACVDITFHWF